MKESYTFPSPIEYMLAATFSGRVVFVSEALTSFLGYDVTGRNLNELFSDDISAQLLYNCRSRGSFRDNASFSGHPVSVSAQTESDEIIIFVRSVPGDKQVFDSTSPINKVSHELDSAVSVLSMMLENLSVNYPDLDADTLSLMNKQLMKLNRLSKNIVSYSQYFSKEHFVNYNKVSMNTFIASLADSINNIVSDMPVTVTTTLPEEDVIAMVDEEKLRRAFLNVITNSIASRVDSININIILQPVISDSVNIVIRDNGCGFTPRTSADKGTAAAIAHAYNSFGFAVCHLFLELHGGHFSVISEKDKGTVVSMSFPQNLDKLPPSFASMIPPYSGSKNAYLMELSPILPPSKFKTNK